MGAKFTQEGWWARPGQKTVSEAGTEIKEDRAVCEMKWLKWVSDGADKSKSRLIFLHGLETDTVREDTTFFDL